jgi:hypothetical protein
MTSSQRGSVMVFIFIGIVLFAALALAVSQGFRLGEGSTGAADEEKARLDASNVLDFARSVQNGVQEMKLNGVVTSAIDFVRPGDEPAYSTAPHTAKIFHPEGGGVTFLSVWSTLDDASEATATDWAFPMNSIENVGGTGNERILTLIRVPQTICSSINDSLTGSNAIPSFTGTTDDLFSTGVTGIDSSNCAGCVGKATLCVTNGNVRVFYFVLDRG